MDTSLASKPRVCFEVERVIGFTSEGNVRTYQVQWAPAWVSSYHLVGCEHLIQEFFKRQQNQASNNKGKEPPPPTACKDNDPPPRTACQKPDIKEVEEQDKSEIDPSLVENENNTEEFDEASVFVLPAELSEEGNFELNDPDSGDVCIVKVEDDGVNDELSHTNNQLNFDPPVEDEENSEAESYLNTSPIKFEDTVDSSNEHSATSSTTSFPTATSKTYSSFYTTHNTEGPISMAHLNNPQQQQQPNTKQKRATSDTKPTTTRKYKNICSICSKRLPSRSQLEIHFRTHTGVKPYQCEHCPKAFAHSSNLTKHLRTHSGEKPYQCHVCGKAFTESSHLKRHSKTHMAAAEGLYVCPCCGVKCKCSAELEQHVLSTECSGYL